MSLWRTADQQDWVLIPLSAQERACIERAREAMQRALAGRLGAGVALGVRSGKLLVYLHAPALPDHRLASAAVQRAQARVARYYGLDDTWNIRTLAAALADDFAARYQDALAHEAASGAAREPGGA